MRCTQLLFLGLNYENTTGIFFYFIAFIGVLWCYNYISKPYSWRCSGSTRPWSGWNAGSTPTTVEKLAYHSASFNIWGLADFSLKTVRIELDAWGLLCFLQEKISYKLMFLSKLLIAAGYTFVFAQRGHSIVSIHQQPRHSLVVSWSLRSYVSVFVFARSAETLYLFSSAFWPLEMPL